jgi:lipoate-protein ligase A
VNINRQSLKAQQLKEIPELKEIYDGYSKWEWRFGETPDFTYSIEHKFPWALMDVQFNV